MVSCLNYYYSSLTALLAFKWASSQCFQCRTPWLLSTKNPKWFQQSPNHYGSRCLLRITSYRHCTHSLRSCHIISWFTENLGMLWPQDTCTSSSFTPIQICMLLESLIYIFIQMSSLQLKRYFTTFIIIFYSSYLAPCRLSIYIAILSQHNLLFFYIYYTCILSIIPSKI